MIFTNGLKRSVVILLMLVITCSFSFAQQNKFFINADFANFRYDKSSTYLEFYYSFNQSQFKIVKTGNDYNAAAIITLLIKSKKNDSIVLANKWKNPMKITDTSLTALDKPLTGVQGFKLPFGEYTAHVICYDENNLRSVDSLQIDLKSFMDPDKLTLSDVQLSSQIQQIPKDEKNIFYKNTLEVIPHPNGVFGIGLPIMFIYLEEYNLNMIKSDSFKFQAQVLDVSSSVIKKNVKDKKKTAESGVEVSTINCSDIPSGVYIIKCIISDLKDSTINAVSAKKFYVYNPQVAPAKALTKSSSMLTNEYAVMTEAELNHEFETVKYIAFNQEKDEYSKLTSLESKRVFMLNFWNNRDRDDDPTQNIMKDKYQKNLKYVNQNYKTGKKEGWKTDRGRVYLMYDAPDEIERHPNESDSKPYEIWDYHNLEGGVQFVFIDKSGMGDYILVHSTSRNEISDTNWQEKLK
jgi:GWxTD domain-containing protein